MKVRKTIDFGEQGELALACDIPAAKGKGAKAILTASVQGTLLLLKPLYYLIGKVMKIWLILAAAVAAALGACTLSAEKLDVVIPTENHEEQVDVEVVDEVPGHPELKQ